MPQTLEIHLQPARLVCAECSYAIAPWHSVKARRWVAACYTPSCGRYNQYFWLPHEVIVLDEPLTPDEVKEYT